MRVYTRPEATALAELLEHRLVFLDGAMGTMLQSYRLSEDDFRGALLRDHPSPLRGNSDLLSLTQPAVVEERPLAVPAGRGRHHADQHLQREPRLPGRLRSGSARAELNRAAVAVAPAGRRRRSRRATTAGPVFVAGALGPTPRTASISPDVSNPAYRAVTFDQLAVAYREQAEALVEGGVDLLLLETSLRHAEPEGGYLRLLGYFAESGHRLPLVLSATITDASGRTLSGPDAEAFYNSVATRGRSVGLNCALGAQEMRPFVQELAGKSEFARAATPTRACRTPWASTISRPKNSPRSCTSSPPAAG